ncbi:histidine phosphatase superfamily [Suillus subalutaceus]|uniref:histidine phosphatase superfamily n=1 Tax=Suillus subalutaceus TaxID=48586 RepID=UPI001B87B16A|nr:histidine phosphatase superfamily [Suillus subalutaceus]KAG1851468.1 histidine phosphatase superfamily [Suillus subalutaceus]
MTDVLGVLVIARNGDRTEYYQDPKTYESSYTESTALGAAESHQLGSFLRSTYMSSSSPSYIADMKTDLVDTHEVHVHAKAGGEGTVIFDSAIALLQGLFPPNPANKIVLANETTVIAPLGGYQYVPIETVEPGNDKSLEPWTDCPAFEQHISSVYSSSKFKETAKAADHFYGAVKDYVFGRPTTLENAIYDYISTELSHNKTYAHRLPPTLVEQARGFADFHENAIFSDKDVGGIGNLAGRTILHTVLGSLQRIAFNGDPLQFLLIETSYQPFISLFHMLEMVKENPELGGIPNYASALAFEAPIKFKNGTNGDFETYHAFGHRSDIAATEFIYRIENYAITSQKQWAAACSSGLDDDFFHIGSQNAISSTVFAILAAIFLLGMFVLSKFVKSARAKAQSTRIRLADDEVTSTPNYGTLSNNVVAQPASMSEKQRLPL